MHRLSDWKKRLTGRSQHREHAVDEAAAPRSSTPRTSRKSIPNRSLTQPEPNATRRSGEYGLFLLYEPLKGAAAGVKNEPLAGTPKTDDEPTVNIIAIHGLNGGADKTWTDKNGTNWLRDLLPKVLPQCRVYTFGYSSEVAFSSSYGNVRDFASRLLASVGDEWEKWPKTARSMIFVCHSLGGIVFKQALVTAHESGMPLLTSIGGVVFLGTPHQGSKIASVVGLLNPQPGHTRPLRKDLLGTLSINAGDLERLSRSVRDRLGSLQIVSFYEIHRLPVVGLIVDSKSAVLNIPGEKQFPLEADHRSMVRYPDDSADNYKSVSSAIRNIAVTLNNKSRPEATSKHAGERTSTHSSQLSLSETEKSCMALISSVDADDYQSSLPQPAPGTCLWILHHPIFLSWDSQESMALLWLKGHPGCGKTVLSVSLARHFATIQSESPRAPKTVLTFFCDDNISSRRTAESILMSLIFQVVSQYRSLLRRYVKKVFENQGAGMARNFTALWRIFINLISDPRCTPTLVILDGLDECEADSRRKLLDHIKSLLDENRGMVRAENLVKFIVTSRPSVFESDVVADHVADYRMFINDGEAGYLGDLKIFVRQRLASITRQRKFSEDLAMLMETYLLNKAGETFLWAQMVLDTLERSPVGSKKEFQAMLSRLPRDLGATYLDFISRIPTDSQETALKYLLLLLSSVRPLNMEEFNIASTIKDSHASTFQISEDEQIDMPRSIHEILGPLIKFSAATVSLLHQSVKDFLVDERYKLEMPYALRTLDTEAADLEMATACVRYLLLGDFLDDRGMTNDGKIKAHDFEDEDAVTARNCELLASKFGFYAYAARHWDEHYMRAQRSAPQSLHETVLKLIDVKLPHGRVWWQFLSVELRKTGFAMPEAPCKLVLTAYLGLAVLNDMELDKLTAISSMKPMEVLNDSLYWATYSRADGIVYELLEEGADPTFRGRDGHTPLTLACLQGDSRAATTITTHNQSTVDLPGPGGKTALMFAAENQHLSAVLALVEANSNLAAQDDDGLTAIHWACRVPNNNDVLTWLVAPSPNPLLPRLSITPEILNCRDNDGLTALAWAAREGVESAVSYLLRKTNVDINLSDVTGKSPLLHAAAHGFTPIARSLAQNPTLDKESTGMDDDGRNAYSWAAQGGYSEIIAVLHSAGVPGVDQPDVDGRTPLAWAIGQANVPAALALIDTKAVDLDYSDENASKAAQWWAAHPEEEGMLRALLDATTGATAAVP